MRLAALLLALLLGGQAAPAAGHALEPGFLELRALGGEVWRVFWKVPQVGTGPMPIVAVLPEGCDARRPPAPRFDGAAYVAEWVATCPGGIESGEIRIEGLERTETDVLVRYELVPGAAENRRLTAATTAFVVPEPQGARGVFAAYGTLGVDHILKGIDHLMFVFALVVLIRDRRRLVGAVTAFTVAHSLSLAAAALGWLVVPAPPVEAVVALSIMFLAAELLRPEGEGLRLTERYPWSVAFAFGLLHGLGFARALLEVGLPEGEVPLALLAFNLGVEAGQLAFIVLVVTVGVLLGRLYPGLMAAARRPGGWGIGVAGYAMGGVAAFWFIGRVAAF
jgi:hydrogenase/urease accessory protein HupE